MGLELLDIQFRIENKFRLDAIGEQYNAFLEDKGMQVTAGDLHEFVCLQLNSQGRSIHGSWPRIKIVLAEALSTKPSEITRESRLIIDLGAA